MADDSSMTPALPLAEIQKLVGPPNQALLNARNKPTDRETHRLVGVQIRSSRVLTDLSRLIGLSYAWWSTATPEKRKKVRGFSLSLLQVAVHYSLELEAAAKGADDTQNEDAAARAANEKGAAKAFSSALACREQLTTALRSVAGTDVAWRSRIDTAVGRADDAGTLAAGIERLVKIGEEMLASNTDDIVALAEAAQVDNEYLADALAEAAALRAADERAGVRLTATKLSQGDLDVLDGVTLSLLSDMVDAFEKAHDRDGTIPRLVPISTRRVLGMVGKAQPAVPTPGPVPGDAPPTA